MTEEVTVTRGTKITLGLLATGAGLFLTFVTTVGVMTYNANAETNERLDDQNEKLQELRLEFRTGSTAVAAEVRHNTAQMRRLTERMNSYDKILAELVELRARIKVLEEKK